MHSETENTYYTIKKIKKLKIKTNFFYLSKHIYAIVYTVDFKQPIPHCLLIF